MRHFSIILSIAAVLSAGVQTAAQAQSASSTLRYTMLANGVKNGEEVDVFGPNGRLDSTYEFNDRGRGPKIEAHYSIAADGTTARLDITGVDYLKAPVDEHFSVEQGNAQWKSSTENGHAAGGGFYIGLNSPAYENALLIQILKKSSSGKVKLYPSGEARLETMAQTTLHHEGQSLHVTEYAITGLGMTPVPIWMDDQLQFFGVPGPWGAILREGWESSNDELYAVQRQAETDRYKRIAKELTRHPQHAVAIEHIRLYDSVHAVMQDDQTVVISGERIAEVAPAASAHIPANAEHIDGRGKTLLPGLFDMHVHLADSDGILHIASGVTTVRDMGNSIDELTRLQKQWNEGSTIGPRLWKAGLIDGRDPMQAPTGIYVDTQEEANAAVNRYADLGYIQSKLYSSLNPKLVPGIIAVSHQRGMRVSGHVPNGMTAAQFVEEGADEIQHINFIFLNFFADRVKDTRTPERFTAVGQYAAGLDLQSKPVNDFIALLLSHHTTVDVTLATFEDMFTARPGQLAPSWSPVIDRLPAQMQRQAYTGGLAVTSANDQTYRDSYQAMLDMTRRLYEAGIPVLAGTDDIAGLMLHRELELEVRAGIPPLKALQNATMVAATVLKQQGDLGSIETGKRADLVLVDGNPAENISDVRRCRTVIKDGNIFDSAALYAKVGIQPAK